MNIQEFQEKLKQIIVTGGTSRDNNGIGVYEYFGSRGFDKGTDFLVYEGPHTLSFPVGQFDEEALEYVLDGENLRYTFEEDDHLRLTVEARAHRQGDTIIIKIVEVE
jgi:hypothetical protein